MSNKLAHYNRMPDMPRVTLRVLISSVMSLINDLKQSPHTIRHRDFGGGRLNTETLQAHLAICNDDCPNNGEENELRTRHTRSLLQIEQPIGTREQREATG